MTETRQEAEANCIAKQDQGAIFIPPYDHDDIILGQGTSCYEALQTGIKPDAIFASCGGGGWLSGSYLAKELLSPKSKIFGAEPKNANDASQSYLQGKIIGFEKTPDTICDGARTLQISERTFQYLKRLDGFMEIAEEDTIYWTQWLMHLLKISVEPTSALAMAAASSWLQMTPRGQTILVLLSGGNIAQETYAQIWAKDYLAV